MDSNFPVTSSSIATPRSRGQSNQIQGNGVRSMTKVAGSVAYPDFALHTLGWKAFQDLCCQVCAEFSGRIVSAYREAQDGGQDGVFLVDNSDGATTGTLQCKFSSIESRRLKPSDVTPELASIDALVAAGRAHEYIFITSMGIDAPVAAAIREKIASRGVVRPEVLGREWISQQIRSSSRLRALVPSVYGLGDLAQILDHRKIEQTRALLGHLVPSLRRYVPTAAHRSAVRILGENRLVLLLGGPATGKSMLAAVLATMASDTDGIECVRCEGPLSLVEHWSPHDPKRLYWVDDAFGPNQMRDDYVDAWIAFMPTMRVALDNGCHFILTSRTHIWNEAKHKLGTRSHQLLSSGRAVVEVGQLSAEERHQILYNHIKLGEQSKEWRSSIKAHLERAAQERGFVPEIARRLGDPNFTSAVKRLPEDIHKFISQPQDFLAETILELSPSLQAAMTLVFLSRSKLFRHEGGVERNLVADKYGVAPSSLVSALEQLRGSFVLERSEAGKTYWSFVHPTFSDAISSILGKREDLVDLYLAGVPVDTLLGEVVCEGAIPITNSVAVPPASFDVVVKRLMEVPNELGSNEKLFQFLSRRCPDDVLRRLLSIAPEMLDREDKPSPWTKSSRHPKIKVCARANQLGVLPDSARQAVCESMEELLEREFDSSFFDDEDTLELFPARDLIRLTVKAAAMLDELVLDEINRIESNADPDGDVEDQFERVSSFLGNVEEFAIFDDSLAGQVVELKQELKEAIRSVERRYVPRDDSGLYTSVPVAKPVGTNGLRSIFSDVDE